MNESDGESGMEGRSQRDNQRGSDGPRWREGDGVNERRREGCSEWETEREME